jgi:hypothetical protein
MTRIAAQSPAVAATDSSISPDQAYWVDADLEIRVDGPAGAVCSRTGRPWGLVGSAAGCDVVLADGVVAEKAIYFHATAEGAFFVDLAAREPQDEGRVGWLGSDAVAVGPYQISAVSRHLSRTDFSRPADLTAAGSFCGPRPVVELSDSGHRHLRMRLSRCLTILGRSKPSHVRVKRRPISAVHAALYVDQDRLWIIDLASLNGVKVNDHRVKAALLRPGDVVSLGGPTLRFAGFISDTQSSAQSESPAVCNAVAPESVGPLGGDFRSDNTTAPSEQRLVEEWIDPSLNRLMVREKARQKRRLLSLAAVLAVAATALGATGYLAWRQLQNGPALGAEWHDTGPTLTGFESDVP